MKKIFWLMIVSLAVIGASQTIITIIGDPNWHQTESNVETVISEAVESGDEVRSDVLNAKFKALNKKLKRVECEQNEGSTFDFVTEECIAPPSYDAKYISLDSSTAIKALDSNFVASGYLRQYMISFWFRSTDAPASGQHHVIMATASNGMAIGWDSSCSLVLLNSLTQPTNIPSPGLCDGQWHNVVLVSTDFSWGIFAYVDGNFISSGSIGGNFLFRDSPSGGFVLGGVETVYTGVNGTTPNFDISHLDIWDANGMTTESGGTEDLAKAQEIYNNGETIDPSLISTTLAPPVATITFGDSAGDDGVLFDNVAGGTPANVISGTTTTSNK